MKSSDRLERYEATLANIEADPKKLLADGAGIDPDDIPPRPDTTQLSPAPERYQPFIDMPVGGIISICSRRSPSRSRRMPASRIRTRSDRASAR